MGDRRRSWVTGSGTGGGRAHDWPRERTQPPYVTVLHPPRTQFSANREAVLTGSQHSPRSPGGLGQRFVTPRQACPWPNGFGRNLRSKTRWFTGFCNSHQVSHFATFFIDARAEISVAESRFGLECCDAARTGTVSGPTGRAVQLRLPWRIPRRGLLLCLGEAARCGFAPAFRGA